MAVLDASTLADQVESALRADILSGRLAAGSRIRPAALAERYGVSPTPLREALQRLAAEGIVHADSRRGMRIPPLSLEEARDLYDTRFLLERALLEDSFAQGDEAWLLRLDAAYRRLVELGPAPVAEPGAGAGAGMRDGGDFLTWVEAHHAFHAHLYDAARSQWTRRLVEVVHTQAERYRMRLTQRADLGDVVRRAERDHEELHAAAHRRDSEQAAVVLKRHMQATVTALEQALGDA